MGSAAREIWAPAATLAAYLTTVLARARRELRRHDPLPDEKAKNAEAVAVFATLAPRAGRAAVVRAIVALQVAIDLRDELEEAGGGEAAPEALARSERLDQEWRREVATLPAHDTVLPHLEAAVERCEEGQRQTHRAAGAGPDPLERWAASLGPASDYRWWELAAGASSSVAAHALIAAAADPETTAATARLVDAAYHPPVGALTVLLDDLVDREADRAAGEHNYLGYYAGAGEAADRLGILADRAEASIALLPHAGRHRAILAGVAGYYLSSPAAATPYAGPIRERLLSALGPGARFLAGFSRLRRMRERKWPGQAGNSPGP